MSNVTSLFEKNARSNPDNSVAAFLAQSLRRPISILLDSTNIARISANSSDPIRELSAEVALWRDALGNRDVASIELCLEENDIAAYDITRLIHDIASQFTLTGCEWRVTFKSGFAEHTTLALLKGLGFSTCQFKTHCSDTNTVNQLADSVRQARAFRFNTVGLQIAQSASVEELTDTIRRLQKDINPDYLFIGASSYKLPQTQFVKGATLFEDDVSHIYCDVLKLGPESVSEIQGRNFNTLSDCDRYKKAICEKQLPLVQCFAGDYSHPT